MSMAISVNGLRFITANCPEELDILKIILYFLAKIYIIGIVYRLSKAQKQNSWAGLLIAWLS